MKDDLGEGQEVHVSIGEVKVGKGSKILKATLGSCIGIGFLWKERGLYGLAHCLLPDMAEDKISIGARSVVQAVPSLIALMHIPTEAREQIEAIIVGGGNMTAPKGASNEKLVGTQNALAAENLLKKSGIRIVYRDVGGEEGRHIVINCANGTFSIRRIPRLI